MYTNKNMNEYADFAVLILSNSRADNVITYYSLRKQGYTGKIYVVVDDEDEQIGKYKENFENVIVFNKEKAISKTDTFDNLKQLNSVVFARNEAYRIAKELNLKSFLVLDDDYKEFSSRINELGNYKKGGSKIKNLDSYFKPILRFFNSHDLDCIALSQGGDYIGGRNSSIVRKYQQGQVLRKAMNAFFLKTDRILVFSGRINEDVNMYVSDGKIGKRIFTLANIRIEQIQTQQSKGGLTDIYLDLGTYVKSFYSVIANPSCVKVSLLNTKHKRFHHRVSWNNAVPLFVSDKI